MIARESSGAFLNFIETAVPATEGHQKFCEVLIASIPNPHMAKLAREIYQTLPVQRRHSVIEESKWYPDHQEAFYRRNQFPKIGARMKVFQDQALRTDKQQILQGKPVEDFKMWAIHPGGPAIVDNVREELGIPPSGVFQSLEVLRNFGNMSSPTIMFIMKKLLEDSRLSGLGCGMAFGPGLTLESFIFKKLN